MRVRFHLILIAIFVGILPCHAYAKEAVPLRYNLKLDLATTIIASTGWMMMEVFQDNISPSTCRWCGVNGFDSWGHDNLKWSNRKAADTASSIIAYGVAPVVSLGLDALAANKSGQMQNFAVDALIIGEAAATSALFNEIIKISVRRQRPDAHYGEVGLSNSSNTSFSSGHTNLAFALAVASGTVATMRDYELAPLIWGAGLAVATTTGYLRIAADRHYITDVLGGAVIGSVFGFGIPYFFHRPKEPTLHGVILSPAPVNGGMVLNVSGVLF